MSDTFKETLKPDLKLIAWELTRSCNLNCVYCRAAAENRPFPNELSTADALRLIDDISSVAKPVIILTGGEILLRKDVFEICAYGTSKGLRMVASTNGVLLTDEAARKFKAAGLRRMSVSIDGSTEELHDSIRKVKGAFKGAMHAVKIIQNSGIPAQINTTISMDNYQDLPNILKSAEDLKANSFHVFFLVATGRASYLKDKALSPQMYEEVLTWLAQKAAISPLPIKTTCAPHFYRITRQQKITLKDIYSGHPKGVDSFTRGCLAGVGFCFISHIGEVYPCGYFDKVCGDIKQEKFSKVWQESKIFQDLRDLAKYQGKCAECEYIKICGGCRARALYKTGNYMDEEPYCIYEPKQRALKTG